MIRRDRRGRRIGHNRWREAVTDNWRCADQAWWESMEAATSLYHAEVAEWRAEHRSPNLGDFMVSLSGASCAA